MTQTYTIKSVNADSNSMVVEFADDNNTLSLNIPLPMQGQTLDQVVQGAWPQFSTADANAVEQANAAIGKSQTPSPVSLQDVQVGKIASLAGATNAQVAAGFMSDALNPGGVTYLYPCSLTDQMNMTASVTDAIRVPADWQSKWTYSYGDSVGSDGGRLLCTVAGVSGTTAPTGPGTDGKVTWTAWTTPFTCQDDKGVWALRNHNAAQIEQAGADGKSFILAVRIKLATLSAQVMAAKNAAAVTAITWAFP